MGLPAFDALLDSSHRFFDASGLQVQLDEPDHRLEVVGRQRRGLCVRRAGGFGLVGGHLLCPDERQHRRRIGKLFLERRDFCVRLRSLTLRQVHAHQQHARRRVLRLQGDRRLHVRHRFVRRQVGEVKSRQRHLRPKRLRAPFQHFLERLDRLGAPVERRLDAADQRERIGRPPIVRFLGDDLRRFGQGLVAFAINEQQPGDHQPRGHFLRLLLDDATELGHRFGARAGRHINRRQPHGRRRETLVFRREVTQQLRGVVRPLGDDVVVGEGERGGGGIGGLGNGLKVRFGFGGASRAHVEDAERAMRLQVVGVLSERVFEGLLRFGAAIAGPEEVDQGQSRLHGLGRHLNRLAERGFRRGRFPPGELNRADVGVRRIL